MTPENARSPKKAPPKNGKSKTNKPKDKKMLGTSLDSAKEKGSKTTLQPEPEPAPEPTEAPKKRGIFRGRSKKGSMKEEIKVAPIEPEPAPEPVSEKAPGKATNEHASEAKSGNNTSKPEPKEEPKPASSGPGKVAPSSAAAADVNKAPEDAADSGAATASIKEDDEPSSRSKPGSLGHTYSEKSVDPAAAGDSSDAHDDIQVDRASGQDSRALSKSEKQEMKNAEKNDKKTSVKETRKKFYENKNDPPPYPPGEQATSNFAKEAVKCPDGWCLLQSGVGTYMAMNFEGTGYGDGEGGHDVLPVRSMVLDRDGIPVKGMLWRLNPDGSIQNKSTGLVLEIEGKKSGRKVPVECDNKEDGHKSQLWTYTKDRTIVSGSNGYLLTIKGGSSKPFTTIWCNFRNPLLGITGAQRWTFIPYQGKPKNPSYPIAPQFHGLIYNDPASRMNSSLA